jgi:hypothetical protein|tara:strand:+ start:7162 stop:7827 length:666 start_codon:yes stop_codon:yes gene_type:complete
MALTTYTDLKTSIANWLNRSDLTTEIAGDFIALAEADFNAKLRIRQMEQIDEITINAETVTVPTGFISVRSLYILSGSTKYNVEYITPANLFKTKGSSTSGLPRVYSIESDNATESFRFAPTPDTSYTGYLQYYKAFNNLSDSVASNYILAAHPAIYLYGSLYHASNFLGGIDPNQTAQWMNMYSMALERCENNDRQDSYGGAPTVQRTDVSTDLSFYRRK